MNVQWGRVELDDVLTMELADAERERFGVQEGDLLVCEGGEIGRAAIWRGGRGYMAFQKALHRVRPSDQLDVRFLLHQLAWAAQNGTLDRFSTGSTIKHLPQQKLRKVPVLLPPMEEQRRIVDILEDHLSRLDAGLSMLRIADARLASLRTARWRSAFDSPVESGPSRALTDVAIIENGQTPRGLSTVLMDTATDDSVPFFKVGDMNSSDGRVMAHARFHIRLQDAAAIGLHVRTPGCVLIPKRGGAIMTNKKRVLGSAAAFDLNTMGLRPTGGLLTSYLFHWLEGVDLGKIADGSNVPQINAPQIRRLSLPVPALDVQESVSGDLDRFTGQCAAAAVAISRAAAHASALRSSLLAAAFSGCLTGHSTDLDRAEELVT